jgi:hypothetical protein
VEAVILRSELLRASKDDAGNDPESAVPAHVVDRHDAKRGHDESRDQNLKHQHCRPCRTAPPVDPAFGCNPALLSASC